MNYNLTGTLNLQDFNNNLVLTFDEANPIGTIFYNLEKDDQGNYQYYFFNCTKLFFRLPGEHIFDNRKYGMELQFDCTGVVPGDTSQMSKKVFVAVPVEVVQTFKPQSPFFDILYSNLGDTSTETTLPVQIKVESFDDILNSGNMFNRIYFYSGAANYPDCMLSSNWIVVENVLKVKQEVFDKLFSLLDKNQIDDGNYRLASPKTEDYFILENKFQN